MYCLKNNTQNRMFRLKQHIPPRYRLIIDLNNNSIKHCFDRGGIVELLIP